MKNIHIIILLLNISIQVQAYKISSSHSQDTLSVKELTDNFNKYRPKEASYNFNRFDSIEQIHTSVSEYFVKSPLKDLKNLSTEGFRAQWIFIFDNGEYHLYLTNIYSLDKSKQKEATKIYSYLEEKYGKIPQRGIPAKWVSGKYPILLCPKRMFGEIISQDEVTLNFQNGIQVSRTIRLSSGSMEKPQIENGRVPIRTGGCWSESVPLHMRYLSRFVNGNRKVRNDSNKEIYFSLLLFTDLKGKSTVVPLDRKEVITANKAILDDLKNCIDKLPLHSFGIMKTLQGRTFQGRYLKATYIGYLGWFFTDYVNSII